MTKEKVIYYCVIVVGLAILLSSIGALPGMLRELKFHLFLVISFFASMAWINLPSGMIISLSFPYAVCAMLTLGPTYALWVTIPGFVTGLIKEKRELVKILYNVSQITISIFLAGLVLGSQPMKIDLSKDLLKLLLVVLVFDIANVIFVSMMLAIKNRKNFFKFFLEVWIVESPESVPIYYATGIIMAICYQSQGFAGVLIVTAPVVGLIFLMKYKSDLNVHKTFAYIDALTQLQNRHALDNWNEMYFSKLVQNNHNASILMIDLDDFKKINDVYGHNVGDEVLKTVAAVIQDKVRKTDFVFRYGGEEFVVILPNSNTKETVKVAERICTAIAETEIPNFTAIHVTGSIGLTHLEHSQYGKEDTLEEMIRQADKAMYLAKQNGKNQVVEYQ